MNDKRGAPVLDTLAVDTGLRGLLGRLATYAWQPTFRGQREAALARALRPYMDESLAHATLQPLEEEVNLGELFLFADYFPDDGQLSLIEQVRDTIDVHVPEEERRWLDPLKHSSMDLLRVESMSRSGESGDVLLTSMGDGQHYRLKVGTFTERLAEGHAVLTRVIFSPDGHTATWPGVAIVLAAPVSRWILEACRDWQRDMEAQAGLFALSDWKEFTKRYGYVLLWMVAEARLAGVVAAERSVQYRGSDGNPFLYAMALYDHHAEHRLAEGLTEMPDLLAGDEASACAREWMMCDEAGRIVTRVVLTPVQLTLECDSAERLNGLKHRLASTFGFLLRFRAETVAVPEHQMPTVDLAQAAGPATVVAVTAAEQRRLISGLLEAAYLEWAERPSPALHDRTPRHAVAEAALRDRVGALIDQMARDDLGVRRTGHPAYDYDVLRAHVGL